MHKDFEILAHVAVVFKICSSEHTTINLWAEHGCVHFWVALDCEWSQVAVALQVRTSLEAETQ